MDDNSFDTRIKAVFASLISGIDHVSKINESISDIERIIKFSKAKLIYPKDERIERINLVEVMEKKNHEIFYSPDNLLFNIPQALTYFLTSYYFLKWPLDIKESPEFMKHGIYLIYKEGKVVTFLSKEFYKDCSCKKDFLDLVCKILEKIDKLRENYLKFCRVKYMLNSMAVPLSMHFGKTNDVEFIQNLSSVINICKNEGLQTMMTGYPGYELTYYGGLIYGSV